MQVDKVSGDPATEPAWEFYDLQKDPKELHNAYQDPQYQHEINQLKNKLLELKRQAGDTVIDGQQPGMQKIFNTLT